MHSHDLDCNAEVLALQIQKAWSITHSLCWVHLKPRDTNECRMWSLQFNKLLSSSLLIATFQTSIERTPWLNLKSSIIHRQLKMDSIIISENRSGIIRYLTKGCIYLLDWQDVGNSTYIHTQWRLFDFLCIIIHSTQIGNVVFIPTENKRNPLKSWHYFTWK